jgi:transposase
MNSTLRYVGLDVHKATIAIAVAEGQGGEPQILSTIPNEPSILLKHLGRMGPPESLHCCYEAVLVCMEHGPVCPLSQSSPLETCGRFR